MSFQYTNITDPTFLETCKDRAEDDYILVKANECNDVPIPNWDPPAYCFSNRFTKYEEDLVNFEVKPDDIWVASYPKSGTTWCQEMVWLICNDLNFDLAKSLSLRKRYSFIDISLIFELPNGGNSFANARDKTSPRFIKTHLPVSMLPKQYWQVLPKTVYIKRNVKSVAVSYYHHSKNYFYRGTKEDFVESFMKDLEFYSPIHSHIIGYHSLQGCENILYLSYEDMKLNLRGVCDQACKFFGYCYSDEQLDQLCNHLSFDSMKDNAACNYEEENDDSWRNKPADERFIRRGQIDSWKEELSSDIVDRLDQWTLDSVTHPEHLNLFL